MIQKRSYIPIIFTIISLLSLIVLLNTTPVLADGGGTPQYTGTEGSVNGGQLVNGIQYAWSDSYKGYRISIISESDYFLDRTLDVWFGEGTRDRVLEITGDMSNGHHTKYWPYPRISNIETRSSYIPAEELLNDTGTNEMPAPWHGFSGNGNALKNWIFSTEEGQEYCNGLRLIEFVWGPTAIEKYVQGDEEYFIVIEGLSMFDILDRDNEKIGTFAGTALNWNWECQKTGQDYGNVWLRRGTNGTFGVGMYVDEEWDGVNKYNRAIPPTRVNIGGSANVESNWLSRSELYEFAYDTHIYTFSSLMNLSTHTWDYDLGETPGPAPKVDDIKRNKINIIKVYCSKDKESEEVISWDGSFLRKENPRSIQIEDEPEYTVEEWKTTRTKNPALPSTWDPVKPMPHIQKGTSQGTVTLDPDKPTLEQTLYVLLVKYEEVDNEKDLILHESEISRYYELRDVKEFKGIDRRIQWTMNQISLGPCTYSPIHSDHGSYTDSEGNSHTIPCNCICNNRQVVITESHLTFKVKNVLL